MSSATRSTGRPERSPTTGSRPIAAMRSCKTGVSPRIYDRANWTSAFLPKDESPMLGDVKFLRETDPSQPAWKLERDDLRLAPQSPLTDTGPDVSRIPQPPASSL